MQTNIQKSQLGSRWCQFAFQLFEAMTFLINRAKKVVRTNKLAERYHVAKVANKLEAHGMGKKMAANYSTEFTQMPEIVQVVRS